MRTVNVEGLKDFAVCGLYYDLKYQQKLAENVLQRVQIAERFEDILKRVASFFFYKKQGGTLPSYNALLNRWEKLWYPKDMGLYELSIEQHEISHGNIASYAKVATASLLQFYEDFIDDPGEPLLIDEKFLIPLAPGVRLEGHIDLVLRNNDHYRVIKWAGRKQRPAMESLKVDFAALKMAFEYRNEAPRSTSYLLYDMGSTRPGFVSTNPSSQDVDAMVFWAKEIDSAALFYPRRGFTTFCRNCIYDKPCNLFEFPTLGASRG